MKLTISKNICTALCTCIISLSCVESLHARASTNSALFIQNEEAKTLKDSLLALQTDAKASKDQRIRRFLLDVHTAASKINTNSNSEVAVQASVSSGVTIDNCTIEGNSGPTTPFETDGVYFDGCKGCTLTNSKILESDLGILIGDMDGLVIDNCFVSSSQGTFFTAIQAGIFLEAFQAQAHNIVISNSRVLNEYGGIGVDGIFLLNGSGCVIENVIVDTITPENVYLPAGIHVGVLEGSSFDDVIIRDSIVQTSSSSVNGNKNSFCILCDHTTNTLIEGCEVSGAVHSNIMLSNFGSTQATQCTVRNCVSNNSAVAGIELAPSATANAIIGNVVSNNVEYGIFVGEGALYNHLEGNKVFANEGYGIFNNEPTTEVYDNTSCNNVGLNCSSVATPLFQQQSPGDSPVVVGSNICCPQF